MIRENNERALVARKIGVNTTILVVEDSPEDYEAIERAFRIAGLMNPIHHCTDGDSALDYLYRRGQFDSFRADPLPGFILLDLNLPGTDGHEVIQELKSDPKMRKIPIIVLTTSGDERDIDACYEAGANSFVKKPVSFYGFIEAVTRLKEFWFEIAILPKEPVP